MIQSFLEEGAWCYWVLSVGALLSFLGLIVACICSCRRNENKNEFLGLAGMVTLNDSDNDGFNRIPMTDALRVATQDAVDSGKRSTTSANRSLPDIPKDKEKRQENATVSVPQDIYDTSEVIGDHSELYATVRDTAVKEHVSEQETPQVLHQNSLIQESSDNQYSRFATSLNSANVEHPYAQLQNVQKTEANQSNRNNNNNNNNSNNNKQTIDADKPSTSTCQVLGNPVAPPRTRRSSSHNSLLSAETGPPSDIQAANAISGGVQANQDLPYMTPPLLMLLSQPPQSQANSPPHHFSGDSQDSKGYTSISVREPLANIIAQTKTICRQNQTSRPLIDPHYATVSDDSDEMYAAIDEQDKVYTSGSETYAQIQPTVTEVQRVQTEQTLFSRTPSRSEDSYPAPQPPSVDSLRHVAHAHSRQASSSSANSSIINPGSPKPEKRQANSPLPPPPEVANPWRILLVVGSGRKLSLVEVNRISWSSHDSMEIQKREPDFSAAPLTASGCSGDGSGGNGNSNGNLHSDGDLSLKVSPSLSSTKTTGEEVDATNHDVLPPGDDHGYEAVNADLVKKHPTIHELCDPNYEILRPHQRVVDVVPDYQQKANLSSSVSISLRNSTNLPNTSSYSASFKHRQISNASSEDPGYEKVRLRKRIEIDQDTDSEPNYESMPHDDSAEPNYASVCRPGDSDTDPNYESVNHGDPNYESVKYMSVTHTEEPPYEQVNAYKSEQGDRDGYEKVKRQKFNVDYERIHQDQDQGQGHSVGPINGDTDDEQYVQV
ncbi:hypothetical protein ANTQUA_LOCUS24 [Anthophora quadrimaculata]